MQECVDAQQPVARERDASGDGRVQVAIAPAATASWLAETVEHIGAVLAWRNTSGCTEPRFSCRTNSRIMPLFVCRAIGAARAAARRASIGRAVVLPRVQVLHVHAVDVAERRHAEADEIRALPQPIAIDERRRRRVLDRGVGAADVIARALERLERLVHPAPLRRPVARPARRTRPLPFSRSPLIVVL